MKKPDPVPGMVVRYDFLWDKEARRGRIEGRKDRPCAIVVVAAETGHVVLVPVTHTPPASGTGIELPQRVKAHLGLDDERSWVVLTDLNRVLWDDAGIVPATRARWDYGALPQPLLIEIQQGIAKLARQQRLAVVNRRS